MTLRLRLEVAEACDKLSAPDLMPRILRNAPQVTTDVVEGLRDEDVLVILLHAAVSWDTAFCLGRRLIERFGSFSSVLNATHYELNQVEGVTPSTIGIFTTIREATIRLARSEFSDRPILDSKKTLSRYLHTRFAKSKTEEVRILFLNTKNVLIEDWLHSRGSVNGAPFYPREILRRAIEVSATALIVVHNHPSGDPTPSTADICATKRLASAADSMDIVLHDHLVVGNGAITSLRAMGLID